MDNLILFSGFYDSEKLNNFVINSNFYYYTNIYLPNVLYIYIKSINKKPLIFLDDLLYDELIKSKKYIKYRLKDLHIFIYENINKLLKNSYKSINNLNELYNIKYLNKNIFDNFNIDYIKFDDYCNNKRYIKKEYEILNIKTACIETSKTIKDLWKNLSKYKYCYELVNHISCILGKKNINEFAYNPICSSGYNNTILHNNKLDYIIKKGDLILLDIGCKFNGYCSDITRTFPYNGKFTDIQKIIYNIVLKINKTCIIMLRPNIDIDVIENYCFETIFNELNKLNFFKPKKRNIKEKIDIASLFMYHKLSHSVGIDVHDPFYNNILKENMIITIEPGIYFKKELLNNENIIKKNIKKYMLIGGIRIEDTVLIKKNKNIILNNISKEINTIEKLLN